MRNTLDSKLFFSKTLDFLTVYIPGDNAGLKTAKNYREALSIFRRYVHDVKGLSISEFGFSDCTFDLVLGYRNWLLDVKHYQPSTVNNRLAAIKSYLYYAAGKDITLQQIQLNVAAVPFLRISKKIRPVIEDPDTIKALLNAPPNTKTGCRDTMILSVLYDTMIRADELIRLDMKDVRIDVSDPYLFIHGKGHKERIVSVSDKTILLIRAYIDEYHSSNTDGSFPFIYTQIHGNICRMSERNIERIVKKYADSIRSDHPDLPSTVYPHMLRRTRGTGLYQSGVPIEAIAVAMGHASIQTTMDHYAFPSLEQKKKITTSGQAVLSSGKEKPVWTCDEGELAILCGLR